MRPPCKAVAGARTTLSYRALRPLLPVLDRTRTRYQSHPRVQQVPSSRARPSPGRCPPRPARLRRQTVGFSIRAIELSAVANYQRREPIARPSAHPRPDSSRSQSSRAHPNSWINGPYVSAVSVERPVTMTFAPLASASTIGRAPMYTFARAELSLLVLSSNPIRATARSENSPDFLEVSHQFGETALFWLQHGILLRRVPGRGHVRPSLRAWRTNRERTRSHRWWSCLGRRAVPRPVP